MFKKYRLVLLFVLVLPLALTACGSPPPADVEAALESLFNEGDASKWHDISCDDEHLSDDEIANFKQIGELYGGNVDFTCEESGSDIKCNSAVFEEPFVLNVSLGKICGGDFESDVQ